MTDEPDESGGRRKGREMTIANFQEQFRRLIAKLKFWILKRISMQAAQ
jgi:hypothetical protein